MWVAGFILAQFRIDGWIGDGRGGWRDPGWNWSRGIGSRRYPRLSRGHGFSWSNTSCRGYSEG
jgi:hypothetical protein